MDTATAFARGEAARAAGAQSMYFDWNKAAGIMRERNAQDAEAGLQGDMEWTGGTILEGGKPVLDSYVFLNSTWATPILVIDGEEIPCYTTAMPEGWYSGLKWPKSALNIFNGK